MPACCTVCCYHNRGFWQNCGQDILKSSCAGVMYFVFCCNPPPTRSPTPCGWVHINSKYSHTFCIGLGVALHYLGIKCCCCLLHTSHNFRKTEQYHCMLLTNTVTLRMLETLACSDFQTPAGFCAKCECAGHPHCMCHQRQDCTLVYIWDCTEA